MTLPHRSLEVPLSMTRYQKGAALVAALRTAGMAKAPETSHLRSVELVEDELETWLISVPPDERIDKELALQILQYFSLLWQNEQFASDGPVADAIEEYEKQVAVLRNALVDSLEKTLAYRPSNDELVDLLASQNARVEKKEKHQAQIRPFWLAAMAVRVQADIGRREAAESPTERRVRLQRATPEHQAWEEKQKLEEARLRGDMEAFSAWVRRNDPNRNRK